jgi:hypothetical protein
MKKPSVRECSPYPKRAHQANLARTAISLGARNPAARDNIFSPSVPSINRRSSSGPILIILRDFPVFPTTPIVSAPHAAAHELTCD